MQLRGAMAAGMPRILGGFAAMGAGLATLSAGMGTFRTALDFARFAGEFDQEMAAVRSISNASTEQFRALSAAAIEAGIQTQFAPAEAAGGLRVLSQQGLIATDAIAGLIPVLDFAAAGNLQVAESAEVAMGVMNAYGMEVTNMTSVTDRLMRGTQLSALSANEFITVVGRAASSGRIFGTQLDDVILALGSMRSAGIPATVATTSLGEAMRRLTTDRGSLETLREFNVEVENSEGRLRSVIDITRDFQQAIQGETEARQAQLVAQVFGVRGMREFSAIANIQARVMRDGQAVTIRGAEAIAHYRRELANAGGTTERFRRDRLATFQGQLTLLSGTVDTFRTVFGHTFGVLFRPIALAITESINLIARAWRGMEERAQLVIGAIILFGGALAVVLGFALTFGGAITVMIALLGELLLVVGAVAAGIVAAMVPVIAIIAALTATAYALWRAWQQNLGGLRSWTQSWSRDIQFAFRALHEIFTTGRMSRGVFGDLMDRDSATLGKFLQDVQMFVARARDLWSGFVARFRELWNQMGPVLRFLRSSVDRLAQSVGGTASTLIRLTGAASTGRDTWRGYGADLAQTVVGALEMVIIATAQTILVLGWLIRLIQHPAFQGFLSIITAIADALMVIADVIGTIADFGESVNPLSWLFAAEQFRRGEDVTAIPLVNWFTGEENVTTAERLALLSGSELPPSTGERARPAVAEAQGRQDSADVLLERLRGAQGTGRGGTTRLQNQMTMMVDRNALGEILQDLEIDTATGNGEIVSDNMSQSRP
jgi:TP901 family phage tail tape measure protein